MSKAWYFQFYLKSHSYSWDEILIIGLGLERLVIKWTVWFCNPSLVSHWRVFYHRRDCLLEGRWKSKVRKYETKAGHEGAETWWRIRNGPGEKEGRRGETGLVLFSRCFLPPPPRIPHCGDLDLEECAPCSVSGENRAGGEKRNSSDSFTHLMLFAEKAVGSAEVSFVWMFTDRLDFPCREACVKEKCTGTNQAAYFTPLFYVPHYLVYSGIFLL